MRRIFTNLTGVDPLHPMSVWSIHLARRAAALLLALFIFAAITAPGLASRANLQLQSQPTTTATASDRHVIMISVDGLAPDYYTNPAPLGLRAPTLIEMKLNGAYAEGVEGVYPSVTYPAHTTLVTGARPATHRIVQNRIFEAPTAPQTKEWYFFAEAIKAPTLWTLAREAGLKTAAVGWPVTVGAAIDYNIPEIFDPRESPPTAKRVAQHATPGLLEKLLPTIATSDTTTDARRTAMSEYLIKAYRPNLMLVHLVDADSAQHRYGPRTPEALAVIEREDGYLARLVKATREAGIFEKTTFLIVSDHGFMKIDKKFAPNVLLVKDGLMTLDASGKPSDWKAAAWTAGGSCAIVLKDPQDKETAARVKALFDGVLGRSKSPLNRILLPAELKKLGAIPEAALMLEAASGYAFDDALTGNDTRDAEATYRGTHGYLPTRAEMRAAFVIYGANVSVGRKLALAKMLDIAPTAAALLGLRFDAAEGAPLREVLKPAVLESLPPAPKKR